ncbi:hypothetical protein [Deinococcus sp. Leaf326]|uniref:hypothetical protein n=1 Tax=Deinococcus sp. Leaf326 TaxID=1736338 RepID=UPI0012E2AE0A|nr:hypothetical protein [Deinococcus sp. Leaf326]
MQEPGFDRGHVGLDLWAVPAKEDLAEFSADAGLLRREEGECAALEVPEGEGHTSMFQTDIEDDRALFIAPVLEGAGGGEWGEAWAGRRRHDHGPRLLPAPFGEPAIEGTIPLGGGVGPALPGMTPFQILEAQESGQGGRPAGDEGGIVGEEDSGVNIEGGEQSQDFFEGPFFGGLRGTEKAAELLMVVALAEDGAPGGSPVWEGAAVIEVDSDGERERDDDSRGGGRGEGHVWTALVAAV